MNTAGQLWADVQENSRKLRACKRHRFLHETVALGQRINCDNCGGFLRLTDIGQYIAGYRAAGGDPADIWPRYAKDLAKATQPVASRGDSEPLLGNGRNDDPI